MKKFFLFVAFSLFGFVYSFAQSQPYYVVFDLTSKDTLVQKAVMRWLTEISGEDPDAKLEVVFYGKSLDMVTQGKSNFAAPMKSLMNNKNISFKVCAIALKNNNVDKNQLLPGVGVVPDGIREITLKQSQGWGYIKAAL